MRLGFQRHRSLCRRQCTAFSGLALSRDRGQFPHGRPHPWRIGVRGAGRVRSVPKNPLLSGRPGSGGDSLRAGLPE